jgi:hypothetical protein
VPCSLAYRPLRRPLAAFASFHVASSSRASDDGSVQPGVAPSVPSLVVCVLLHTPLLLCRLLSVLTRARGSRHQTREGARHSLAA